MSFLFDNAAVVAVAAMVSFLAWIFGGARGDLLLPGVPWALVLMAEVAFCFPQRHHGESTVEARVRVWRELRRNPLVWVSCGFLGLLLVPFVNNGLCVDCDRLLVAQGISPAPPVPFLPFCVNRMDHLNVVIWFAVAFASMLAVSICLTGRGKRRVVEFIVWNGMALAVLGFVQNATGAKGPFWCGIRNGGGHMFFSTFGYPNMAGDYFTTLFGLAAALWRDRCDHLRRENEGRDSSERAGARRRGDFWRKHYFLIPAAVFYFAALTTLSRAAIILATALAFVFYFHTLKTMLSRMRRVKRVKIGVWSTLILGTILFFASVFMPENLRKEVDTFGTTEVLDRVTGRAQHHVTVATSIWRDHFLFGCGGWGYLHFCVPKMRELGIDLRDLERVGGINVHNDYLQFLAEHGTVGFGALLALVVLMMRPVVSQWRQRVRDLRFKRKPELPPRPVAVFALPAGAFFILVTALATLIHAFGDCPFRSMAVLVLFFVSLAAVPGFMPGKRSHG